MKFFMSVCLYNISKLELNLIHKCLMFKYILDRKHRNKPNNSFHFNFPKHIECFSKKSINNKKICSDFSIESLENRFMLCGFINGNIKIYDIEFFLGKNSGQIFSLHNNSQCNKNNQIIKCVQWYPVDSGLFFTCSTDRKVKIWDTNNGICVEEISISYDINWISMSPCARHVNLIAVACSRNRTTLIDLVSGSSTHVLTNYSMEPFQILQWSNREEHLLATGDQAGHVSMWDVRATKKALFHFDQYDDQKADYSNSQAHGGSIRGLEFSPDGISLATLGNDGRVNVWDLFSNKAKLKDVNFGNLFNVDKASRHVRFCWTGYSTNKVLWVPSNLDLIKLNLVDGMTTSYSSMHFDQITSCLWNPGYQQFCTSAMDSNILFWNSTL